MSLEQPDNSENFYPLILKLYSQNSESPILILSASKYGYFHWIQLLAQKPFYENETLWLCFRSGYTRIVQFLLNLGCSPGKSSVYGAIGYGQIEILQILVSRGFRFEVDDIRHAARYGNLLTFSCVLKNGLYQEYNLPQFLVRAIQGDNLEIIKYLDSLGVKISQNMMIEYINPQTVEYLIELGYPLEERF